MEFDQRKFSLLVQYVAWKVGKHDWFGATKLYKVLWFADARLFVLRGKPITGETYIRKRYGPAPKHIEPILKQLEGEGIIRTSREGDLRRIVATYSPDMSTFSSEEMQTIDYWINHIDREHTATSISEESHDYAWGIAKMGEELPLYAILANRIREPDDAELERLKEKAKALGLA